MFNYNNPKVELPPNPKGVDKAIQGIQVHLSNELDWLQTVFGRANQQIGELNAKEVTDKRLKNIFYFPEVWRKGEPMNVFVNDNLTAYVFFFAPDSLEFNDYDTIGYDIPATQKVSIYFWANLSKVDPVKYKVEGNYVEHLRADAVTALRKLMNFRLRESFMSYLEVFAPFTITTEFRELLKPPFVAFRIDGEVDFDYFEACIV